MKIAQENKNDVVICKIDGEINISTSPELRKFFDNLVQNKTKKIILDFTSLSYIDSSGLATLIELLQRIKKIDGKFYICNMSDKIKNIFEITKLHKLFEVFENQELALNKF
ncbi:MAG: STAS domain-containing protein [Candidatus Omnitrophota bacterium]